MNSSIGFGCGAGLVDSIGIIAEAGVGREIERRARLDGIDFFPTEEGDESGSSMST